MKLSHEGELTLNGKRVGNVHSRDRNVSETASFAAIFASFSMSIGNVRAALRLVFLYEKDVTDGFDSLLQAGFIMCMAAEVNYGTIHAARLSNQSLRTGTAG